MNYTFFRVSTQKKALNIMYKCVLPTAKYSTFLNFILLCMFYLKLLEKGACEYKCSNIPVMERRHTQVASNMAKMHITALLYEAINEQVTLL